MAPKKRHNSEKGGVGKAPAAYAWLKVLQQEAEDEELGRGAAGRRQGRGGRGGGVDKVGFQGSSSRRPSRAIGLDEQDDDFAEYHRPVTRAGDLSRSLTSLTSAFTCDPTKDSRSLVMARNSDGLTKTDAIKHNRLHRQRGKELYGRCGHSSPMGQPYRPFEGDSSFIDQRRHYVELIEKAKNELYGNHELGTAELPIDLFAAKGARGTIERYGQKIYCFDLLRCPMVRESDGEAAFQVTFELEAVQGDPDLFVGADMIPSTTDYTWASAGVGEDIITVLPTDPDFVNGKYFVLVSTSDPEECVYTITATPKRWVDEVTSEIMAEAHKNLYDNIQVYLKDSNARRVQSKFGTQNWSALLSETTAKGPNKHSHRRRKDGRSNSQVSNDVSNGSRSQSRHRNDGVSGDSVVATSGKRGPGRCAAGGGGGGRCAAGGGGGGRGGFGRSVSAMDYYGGGHGGSHSGFNNASLPSIHPGHRSVEPQHTFSSPQDITLRKSQQQMHGRSTVIGRVPDSNPSKAMQQPGTSAFSETWLWRDLSPPPKVPFPGVPIYAPSPNP